MRPYVFLLLIAGATLLFRLGDLPFTGADEPRYARIAEEMHLEGRWVTPVLQGLPWLEKPPLYYWITIALYSVFGIGETTARMGPALCALLAAWAVCWAGRRSKGPVAGFMAGVVTLTTLGISVFGRGASTDMPLTAFYTVALSILYVSLPEKQPSRVLLASG
ncbi:MAG: phospholipid carrier-dependent glycosyltransferase, partial [Acidobacteria bacterium]|nr:phospholipid carrier-dependent glycosyltransferase [Acidobacteriota bacterium]